MPVGKLIRTEARTAIANMRNCNVPLGAGFGSGETALELAYAAAAEVPDMTPWTN